MGQILKPGNELDQTFSAAAMRQLMTNLKPTQMNVMKNKLFSPRLPLKYCNTFTANQTQVWPLDMEVKWTSICQPRQGETNSFHCQYYIWGLRVIHFWGHVIGLLLPLLDTHFHNSTLHLGLNVARICRVLHWRISVGSHNMFFAAFLAGPLRGFFWAACGPQAPIWIGLLHCLLL